MKTYALSFILMLIAMTFFMGCEKEHFHITPSNQVSTIDHTLTDFDELKISDPFQVYIEFSDTEQKLRIEANDNLHSFIKVEQSNDRLSIKLKDGIRNIDGVAVLKVYLTTKDIESIEAHGAANIYLQDPWNENQANVELTGACTLDGTITADKLTAEITGASTLTIEGSARVFDLEATGASDMTGFDFATDEFTADLTGSSEATLTVHESLRVTATGASTVRYQGEGVVEHQDLSGGSSIIQE